MHLGSFGFQRVQAMRAFKLLFVLSLLISFILFLAGCNLSFTKEEKAPRKTVVVLADLSESTIGLRDLYLNSLAGIIQKMEHGDFLMVAKITESSINEPEVPIKEEFPAFIPKDAADNPTDNPLLVREARQEADADLEVKRKELLEITKKLLMPEEKQRRKVINTDVMSSLLLARNAFQNYQREKNILVIFSDMIEDSPDGYSFYREKLTDQRINTIIEAEKAKGLLPDLKGVKVYVVAASTKDSKRFLEIQKFWLKYFSACGADLSKENYNSTMLKFNE